MSVRAKEEIMACTLAFIFSCGHATLYEALSVFRNLSVCPSGCEQKSMSEKPCVLDAFHVYLCMRGDGDGMGSDAPSHPFKKLL